MKQIQVFGALRATSIVTLCAGAGLALAGCDAGAKKPVAPAAEKPAVGTTGKSAADPKSGAEKPGGEMTCSPGQCAANTKPK